MKLIGSHVQNTTLSSAVSISVGAQATHIAICAKSNNVRLTLDGTVPTATKGFLIVKDAAPVVLPVPVNGTLKVIEVAASAEIDYQLFA